MSALQIGVGAICSCLVKFLHHRKDVSATYPNAHSQKRLDDLEAVSQESRTISTRKTTCITFKHKDFPGTELYAAKRWVTVKKEGPQSGFFGDFFVAPAPSTMASTQEAESDDKEEQTCSSSSTTKSPTRAKTVSFHSRIVTPNPRQKKKPRPEAKEPLQVVDNPTCLADLSPNMGNNHEDISLVRNLGFDVDDDNLPLPENVAKRPERLERDDRSEDVLKKNKQSWGWSGSCERRASNCFNTKAKLGEHYKMNDDGKYISYLMMFLIFFPTLIIDTIVAATSAGLESAGYDIMTKGEFLRFIGLWLFMATVGGSHHRRSYWSSSPISEDGGAPFRFHTWMSRQRFERILFHLRFTSKEAPSYADKFWEVRDLIKRWNRHMKQAFKASWVSCLDESISIWFNRWSCPGWVFCPRKPHPFGNEYHTICCALSGIMFQIELVEGKDQPKEEKERLTKSNRKGTTVGLLLRLCEPLFATGKVVVLDSGFSVLQALIELRKKGVFAAAVAKKRRYWPKFVPGNLIIKKMKDAAIGSVQVVQGKLDGVGYNLFCMREPDYVMKLMSTYGTLDTDENSKLNKRTFTSRTTKQPTTASFKYTEVFNNHFKYRHCVDDHNHLRHSVPSIEGTWVTSRWACRVFSFILAISEVNTYLAFKYFIWGGKDENEEDGNSEKGKVPTLHEFRRKLALELINNEFLPQTQDSAKKQPPRGVKIAVKHTLKTAPNFASYYRGYRWVCRAKSKYQQYTCKRYGCTRRIRTYCSCEPSYWLCKECHLDHCVSVAIDKEGSD